MIRNLLLSLIFIALTISLQAQDTKAQASVQVMLPEVQDMELLSSWRTGTRDFNDVWGYVDSNGDEVAIIGSRSHFYFVDIEDPTDPQLIDGYAGGNVTVWRDMKTYGQWAYGVCDSCNEGLSIFKLGDSPKDNGVQFVQQTTNWFSSAHNIFIDEEHGRLYVIGTNTQRNGVIILDIKTNPEQPILLAAVDVPGGYMHDLYVRNHIGYGNSESRGLFVYNFSNPTSPQFLGSMTSYLQQGYNHSCWLNPAGDVLIMADETHNTSLKAVDVSDLSDIEVTSLFRSELLAPAATGSIAHNPFVRDNYAVVSYYHDGIQIFDISDPANVQQVAWYDTFTGNTGYSGFDGAWGAYPFLPSGNILGSDDASGLFVLRPTQITFDPIVPVQPPFAFLTSDVPPCVPTGTPVTLSLSTDAHTIQWYRNGALVSFNANYTATSEGTYTAIVYKGPHSLTLDPIEIVYGETPMLIDQFPDPSYALCGENGGVDLVAITDIGDSYIWFFNGIEQPQFAGTGTFAGRVADEPGLYSVVFSANGCETQVDFNITQQEVPVAELNFTGTQNLCEGDTLVLENQTVADSYQWAKQNFNSFTIIVGETSPQLIVTDPGTYRLQVTVGNCTDLSDEVEVLFSERPEAVLNQTESIVGCQGEFVGLSTDSAGESYEWYEGFNTSTLVGTGQELLVGQAGFYRVEVANGSCVTSSEMIAVEFAEAPEVIFDTSQNFTFCAGESFTLTVLTQGVEYAFTGPNGFTTVGTDNSVEITEAGQIVVTVTSDFCTSTATIDIIEGPSPEATINVIGDPSICNGESNMLASQNDAESYLWFLDGAPIMGATTSTYLADQRGNYTLELTTSDGCTSLSDAYTLEVVDVPVIELVDGINTFLACEGDVVTLQISGEADQYVWTDFAGNTLIDDTSFEVTTAGQVSVQAFNGNCASQELFFAVEVFSQSELDIIATDEILCEGESTTLQASIDGTTSDFVWIRNGETIVQNQIELIIDQPGLYSIQQLNGPCFSSSPEIEITAGVQPNTNINSNFEIALCEGDTYTIEAAAGQGSYTWFRNSLPIDDATANSFMVNSAGTYSVMIISTDGCFGESDEYSFTFIPLPNATIQSASEQNICEGTSVLLESPEIAASYIWTLDGQVISTEANLEANQPGVYQLELISVTGCSNLSQEITVDVDANPVVLFDIGPEIIICDGESFTTNFNLDFDTYQWFFKDQAFSTDENIEISETGIYYLEATSNNCTGTSGDLELLVQELPSAELNVVEGSTDCEGGSTLLLAPQGAQSYTWYRNDDPLTETSNQLLVEQTGTYRFELSDGDCSNSSDEISIVFSANPDAIIAGEATQTICAGESLLLTTDSEADEYFWIIEDLVISTGADPFFEVQEAGEYTLMTSIGDCTTLSEPVIVELLEVPALDPDVFQDYILCEGESLTIAINIQQGEITMYRDDEIVSVGQTTFELSTPGVYYFDYRIGDCVERSDDLTVSLVMLPSLADLPTETSLCAGDDFVYDAPAGLDSYVWTKDGEVIVGATTNELLVSETGTYSLAIEQDGCVAQSAALEVEVITLATVEIFPSLQYICGDVEVLLSLSAFDYDSTFLALNDEIISSDQNEVFISESGIYTIIGKTGDCTTESNPFEFIFSDFPEITPVAAEVFVCPGDIANLAVTGQEDLEYTWIYENGAVVGTEMSIEATAPGVYTSEVIDQATGCAASTSITLSNYEITIPTIAADANILTSTAGETYQWYLDGALIADANASVFTAETTGEYQVAVTDINGCITFSEAVLIELTSTQSIRDILSADLFPNPATDRLALSLTTDASLDLEITVYNQLGQSLWTSSVQQQGEQTYVIPVNNLSAGLYYLRVQNKAGHQQTYKFIKQ